MDIRRRFLAPEIGGGRFELHLTPQWEGNFGMYTAEIRDDFSDLYNKLVEIAITQGNFITNMGFYSVDTVPSQINFTVDGEKLIYYAYYPPGLYTSEGYIEPTFGDAGKIAGVLYDDVLSLDKDNMPF